MLPWYYTHKSAVQYTEGMKQAARAIIIEDNKILVMHRNKEGNEYFTLVGGQVQGDETVEQALAREVKEETGLQVVTFQLVFTEDHPEPYNKQFIYLCSVAPHGDIALQEYSEEAMLNKLSIDIHKPFWVSYNSFDVLPFRTPQLQAAIIQGVNQGFPATPQAL